MNHPVPFNKRKSARKSQSGFGDNMAILMVLGVSCVIGIAVAVLGWVKETKDERTRHDYESSNTTVYRGKRQPHGYTIIQ